MAPINSRIVYTSTKKSKPPSPRPRRIIWGNVVIFVFILAGVGLWYGAHASYIRVKNIEVTGTSLLDPKVVDGAIRANLAGRRWLFVPKDNILAVSSKELAERLRDEFPSIAEVSIAKDFPHTIRATIRERVLWGIYCQAHPIPEKPYPCAYLDEGGTAFQEFSNVEGWLLPIIIGSATPVLGKEIVSEGMLGYFRETKDVLGSVSVELLSLRESTTTPEDVSLATAEGWEIRIQKSHPVSEWFPILKTLLDKEIGTKRPQLEYVDLRFGQKVFYKLK
jgi:hypothetical protein